MTELCEYLIREVGVVVIPSSVFYLNPEGKKLVRFTFCKDEDTLRAAVERMKTKLRKK
jgi:aspartate/methionine/tyrosine aminotransferase